MRRSPVFVALALIVSLPAAAQDLCPSNDVKEDPGFCGCHYYDLDVDADLTTDSCQHIEAQVALDATIGIGVTIEAYASVESGAVLADGVLVAERTTIREGAYVGVGNVVGRRATVGADADVGDDSTLGRGATVGDAVEGAVGRLTMGYASLLGEQCVLLGPNINLGNLASILGGPGCEVGGGTILARGATVGADVALGDGVILGPEVEVGDNAVLADGIRIRKQAVIEPGAQIGRNVRIGRDTTVRAGARIGDNAVLRAQVTVGENAVVPENTLVHRGTIIEGSPTPAANQAPVVTITSPSGAADSASGAVTVSGTLADDAGVITNVTYRIDDGAPVVVDMFDNTSFSSTVAVPATASTLRITAFDEEGLAGSSVLLLSNCSQGTFDAVWTGDVSSVWSDGANWEGGVVPSASADDVFICGALANQPELAADVSLNTLTMSSTATLETNGFTVTSASNVVAGAITGEGTLSINGGTLRGQVPNLQVTGNMLLSGATHATGDVSFVGDRRLDVSGRTLEVDGDWVQGTNNFGYGLYMVNAADDVTVAGNFSSGSITPTLTAGTLHLLGDLNVTARYGFQSGANHTTRFEGTVAQTASLYQVNSSWSRFGRVEVVNPAGVTMTVSSTNDITMTSLTVESGSSLVAPELTVSGDIVLNGDAYLGGLEEGRMAFVDVTGDLVMNDASRAFVDTVHLRAGLHMDPLAELDANLVRLYAELVPTDGTYTVARTELVGQVSLTEDTSVDYPDFVTVAGSRLSPNGHTLLIDTDYTHTAGNFNEGLYMNNGGDDVTITGAASFPASSPMLNAGVLHLQGPVSIVGSYGYRGGAGHITRFEGGEEQALSLYRASTGFSWFGAAEVASGTALSVSVTSINQLPFASLTLEPGSAMAAATAYVSGAVDVQGDAQLTGVAGGRMTTLDVGEDLVLGGTSTVLAGTTHLRAGLNMTPDSTLDATLVRLYSELTPTAGHYNVPQTEIAGPITLYDDVTVTYPNLVAVTGSELRVNGHTLVMDTDFTQTAGNLNQGLYMNHGGDDVTITGTATFQGYLPTLTAGVLRLQGDMNISASYGYRPGPGHITRFEGTGAQALTMYRASTGFNAFGELQVGSGADVTVTVTSTNNLPIASLVVEDGASLALAQAYVAGTTTLQGTGELTGLDDGRISTLDLSGDLVLGGTSTVYAATAHLRAGLSMAPASTLDADLVRLYSQLVPTDGIYAVTRTELAAQISLYEDTTVDYPDFVTVAGSRLAPNGHALLIDTDYTNAAGNFNEGLYMNNGGDDVTITGTASFPAASPLFNSGVLHLQGPVSVVGSYGFRGGAGHITRFEGGEGQTLSMYRASSGFSSFGAAEVASGTDLSIAVTSTNQLPFASLTLEPSSAMATAAAYVSGDLNVQGDAQLEGIADGRITTLDVGGDLVLGGTSITLASTVHLRGGLEMTPDSTLDATLVRLYSELTPTNGHYNVPQTDIVDTITLYEDVTVTYPNLVAATGSQLRVNGHTLVIDTDFTQTAGNANQGLYMNNGGDDVTITGSATFQGYLPLLNAGVLRLRGAFSTAAYYAYQPGAGHLTRFEGDSPQAVSLYRASSSYNAFGDVELASGTSVAIAVTSTNSLPMDSLVVEDGAVLATDRVYINEGLELQGTGRVEGLNSGRMTVLDVSGDIDMQDTSTLFITDVHQRGALTMAPGSELDAATVRLYSELGPTDGIYNVPTTYLAGFITLSSDITVTYPNLTAAAGSRLTVNGRTLVIDSDYTHAASSYDQGLYMNNASDDVTITGDATFTGTFPTMNAGVLRLHSDLVAGSGLNFRAEAGHTTRFEGTSTQEIRFGRGGSPYSFFGDLVVGPVSTVTYAKPQTVNGTAGMLVKDDLSVEGAGVLQIEAAVTPDVSGDLYVATNGTVVNNGNSMTVGGTCDIQGTFTGPSSCL